MADSSSRIIHFLQEQVWSVLPARISRRMTALAAAVWGGALLAIAGWTAWSRARAGEPWGTAPWVTAAFGIALAAVLLTPVLGQAAYRRILQGLAVIGFLISTIILTLSFYIVVTPLGWLLRRMGKDPLALSRRAVPKWTERDDRQGERRRFYRMF
jgi:hypothetical protein